MGRQAGIDLEMKFRRPHRGAKKFQRIPYDFDTLILNIFVPTHENLLFFHIRRLKSYIFTGRLIQYYTKY